MFAMMQHRPIMIAERHHQTIATYKLYLFLKENSHLKIDYLLFEGADSFENHMQHAQNAFNQYQFYIAQFLQIKDPQRIYRFLSHDLEKSHQKFTQFIVQNIQLDFKMFPYGFGHIKNLSVHWLIYHLLKRHNTQWIAIDYQRQKIKKFATQKVKQGKAYLFKKQGFATDTLNDTQKILLEAALMRSKFMSDEILDYASMGNSIALIGARHAYDMAFYVPDLADIFGYHPINDTDDNFYHYKIAPKKLHFEVLKYQDIAHYCRSVSAFNAYKIKSDFDLKASDLLFLKAL